MAENTESRLHWGDILVIIGYFVAVISVGIIVSIVSIIGVVFELYGCRIPNRMFKIQESRRLFISYSSFKKFLLCVVERTNTKYTRSR